MNKLQLYAIPASRFLVVVYLYIFMGLLVLTACGRFERDEDDLLQ